MRTVVTGAAGFVGRHTVTELLARGHEVVAVVRPSSAVPEELAGAGVELLAADLRRAGAEVADAIAGADALVHLAAGSEGSPRARFDATVLAHRAADRRDPGGRLARPPRPCLVARGLRLQPAPPRRDHR